MHVSELGTISVFYHLLCFTRISALIRNPCFGTALKLHLKGLSLSVTVTVSAAALFWSQNKCVRKHLPHPVTKAQPREQLSTLKRHFSHIINRTHSCCTQVLRNSTGNCCKKKKVLGSMDLTFDFYTDTLIGLHTTTCTEPRQLRDSTTSSTCLWKRWVWPLDERALIYTHQRR